VRTTEEQVSEDPSSHQGDPYEAGSGLALALVNRSAMTTSKLGPVVQMQVRPEELSISRVTKDSTAGYSCEDSLPEGLSRSAPHNSYGCLSLI